jgi:hypothetical protein
LARGSGVAQGNAQEVPPQIRRSKTVDIQVSNGGGGIEAERSGAAAAVAPAAGLEDLAREARDSRSATDVAMEMSLMRGLELRRSISLKSKASNEQGLSIDPFTVDSFTKVSSV